MSRMAPANTMGLPFPLLPLHIPATACRSALEIGRGTWSRFGRRAQCSGGKEVPSQSRNVQVLLGNLRFCLFPVKPRLNHMCYYIYVATRPGWNVSVFMEPRLGDKICQSRLASSPKGYITPSKLTAMILPRFEDPSTPCTSW